MWDSSSPACEFVLLVNCAYENSPDSLRLRPALPTPAHPAAPSAWCSQSPRAEGEPVPERASSAGTRGPHLSPLMWRHYVVEGHGGPDRVPQANWTAVTPGSPSYSGIVSGGDLESSFLQVSKSRSPVFLINRPDVSLQTVAADLIAE